MYHFVWVEALRFQSCQNIHYLSMREGLIFFMGIWSHVERKKTMMSIFYWLDEKGRYNIMPRKRIGALIGGGGHLKR